MTYPQLRAAVASNPSGITIVDDEYDYATRPAVISALLADFDKVVRERDALREALAGIVESVDAGNAAILNPLIDKARSALALEKQQ